MSLIHEEEFVVGPDTSEVDAATSTELYSIEPLLSSRPGSLRLVEGKVSCNPAAWTIARIPPTFFGAPATGAPDWDFYLIHAPYTIHMPPGRRHYTEVTFMITLDSKEIIARDLLPSNVTTPVRTTQTYTLSPEIMFKEVGAQLGSIRKKIKYVALEPVISAFGIGESRFYWVHKAPTGQAVTPETKHAFIVLQTPKGAASITGTIEYRAVMAQQVLGAIELRQVKSDAMPLLCGLAEAPGLE